MSEPYEPHFKRCYWCGADVPPEEYDKERACCKECQMRFKSIETDS